MQRVRTGWLRLFCLALAAMGPMTLGFGTLAAAQNAPGPGEKAPAITIDALTNAPEGAKANWEALGRGTTVIEFWGTWCGPCVAAIPHINELHDEFAPKGVHFLSVTYEEPELVDRFRERMPMRTWIGHDMDRDMVRAYGVRGWPTTFVVRDGVIVARTHPNTLTRERLAALVAGKGDPAVASLEAQAMTISRPAAADGPSAPADEPPIFQVLIRKGGDEGMIGFGSTNLTMQGIGLRSVIGNLWDGPMYTLEIDPRVPDDHYDVICTMPHEMYDHMRPMVRDIVMRMMQLRSRTEPRSITGYEARLAPGGLKLQSGLGERSGMSSSGTRESLTITSASAPFDTIIGNVSGVLNAPVVDKTGAQGYYCLNLTLPRDPEQLKAALRERVGLVLVPFEQSIEVTIIEPVKD